ncbi:serine/arginine repetitive matrix protein 1 isoform X1 [Hydra vulgaris]|uniref:serine/arginine repetitive matrix protein 1 isoform X1 n=2 Tax=Hydra vulgaris TaxID=6087 RepID=UPI001F5E4A9A|nr:serine/arginine repetitive matrix protein 1 isoform X1 [Hydra vulgaris]
MADAGFFRGTTSEQDSRFADKEKKLMKKMKFDPLLTSKVDMEKVNLDTIKPWVQSRITSLLGGIEDEVLIGYIYELLESQRYPDPKSLQISVTGFLNGKNARIFMGELWAHLVSAQTSIAGIPEQFLEKKKEEILIRKQETERITANLQKTQAVEADSTEPESKPPKQKSKQPVYKEALTIGVVPPSEYGTPAMKDQREIRKSLTGYMSSPACTPVCRDKAGWYGEHEKHVEIAKTSSACVLLIGDSIIQGLARYPKIWNKYFSPLKSLNFGLGGDRTQHVLWRVENGEIPLNAQTIVIHVGTNNTDRDSPKDIANGIGSIAMMFQEAKPNAKIILAGLLPRDLQPSFKREQTAKVNKYLKKLCKSGHIRNFYYLKPDADWVLSDGTLNTKYYFHDHLHLVEEGDEKFGKAIFDIITKIYGGVKIEMSSDSELSDDYTSGKNFKITKQVGHPRSVSPGYRRRSISRSPRRYSRSPKNSRTRSRSRSPRRRSRSPRRRFSHHSSYGRNRRRSRSRSYSRSPIRRNKGRQSSRSPDVRHSTSVNINTKDQVKSVSPKTSSDEELVKIQPADEGLMKEVDEILLKSETSPIQYQKSGKTQNRTYRRQQSESDVDNADTRPVKPEIKTSSRSPISKKRSRYLSPQKEKFIRRDSPRRFRARRSISPQQKSPLRSKRSKTFSQSPPKKFRRQRSPISSNRHSLSRSQSPVQKAAVQSNRSSVVLSRKQRNHSSSEESLSEDHLYAAHIKEKEMAERLRKKHSERKRQQRSLSASSEKEDSHDLRRKKMLEAAAKRMAEKSDSDNESKESNIKNLKRVEVKKKSVSESSSEEKVTSSRVRKSNGSDVEFESKGKLFRNQKTKEKTKSRSSSKENLERNESSSSDQESRLEQIKNKIKHRKELSTEHLKVRERSSNEVNKRQLNITREIEADSDNTNNSNSESSEDSEDEVDQRKVILRQKSSSSSSSPKLVGKKNEKVESEPEVNYEIERNFQRSINKDESDEEDSEEESASEHERHRHKARKSRRKTQSSRRKSKKKKRKSSTDEDSSEEISDVEKKLRDRALKSMQRVKRRSESD